MALQVVAALAGPSGLGGGDISQPTLTNNTVATTETIVARWRVPAGRLSVGQGLLLRFWGQVSATATLVYRIRFGTAGTTADALVATFATSAAGAANQHTGLDALISVLSSTTMSGHGSAYLANARLGQLTAAFTAANINLTAVNFLSVTVVQSVAQTLTSRAAILRS